MARLPKAPMAPVALLQVAGAEWHAMLSVDLLEMQQLLAPTLDQLPPSVDLRQWCNLAAQYTIQWENLSSAS